MSGKYHFSQSANPAAVINQGEIRISEQGGALLGGAVVNHGVIVAKESNLALASGSEATVSFDDSGMLSMIVDKGVVKQLNVEEGGQFKVSAAEHMLSQL